MMHHPCLKHAFSCLQELQEAAAALGLTLQEQAVQWVVALSMAAAAVKGLLWKVLQPQQAHLQYWQQQGLMMVHLLLLTLVVQGLTAEHLLLQAGISLQQLLMLWEGQVPLGVGRCLLQMVI
jgi:hypothetical protein